MKRSRWIVLPILFLLIGVCLPSCGKTVKTTNSWETVLNSEYIREEAVWTEILEEPELEGFQFYHVYDERAIWFEREENKGVTYALYNVLQQEIVLSFFFRENLCEIALLRDGLFQVTERTPETILIHMGSTGSSEEHVPSELVCVTIYDAMGNTIAYRTADEPETEYYALTENMVVVEGVLYEVEEKTGAYVESETIPPYNVFSKGTSLLHQGAYFYAESSSETISVFDEAWNMQSTWSAPSYAENLKWFVLNDGNVLIQYRYELDENEKSYDFYEVSGTETVKFNMVTLWMNAKNGRTKMLDLSYHIADVCSNTSLVKGQEENPVYTDEFENIAYVYPIVDQQIDFSDGAKDIVLMSNKGKIEKSLKLLDVQKAELPKKVGDGLYRVSLLTGGYAIVTADGEIVRMINNTDFILRELDFYYISKNGVVYNSVFEEVYNWKENWKEDITEARMAALGSSLFIWTPEEIIQLRGDEIKELLSFEDGADSYDFDILDGMGYEIHDDSDDTYIYYNEDGTELLRSERHMYGISRYSEDARIQLCRAGEKYYIVTR